MDGLGQLLGSMVAIESQLEERLAELSPVIDEYLEAPSLVEPLHSLVASHRDALAAHREELADSSIPQAPTRLSALLEGPLKAAQAIDLIARLENLAAAFAQTAFRYTLVHGFAHRFYQVDTADLADQHRVNYMRAAQNLHQILGDVVVEKLQAADHSCRCHCPSCSPGACLCWHAHVDTEGTGPGVTREGIVVREPRAGSNAQQAGLQHGDVILAVEGKGIGTYQDMLDNMLQYEPGEEVELSVRRRTGDQEQIIIR